MPKKNPINKDVRYEVITQEDADTGDIIVPLPQTLLDSLGWKEGDELLLELGKNGEIYVKKN